MDNDGSMTPGSRNRSRVESEVDEVQPSISNDDRSQQVDDGMEVRLVALGAEHFPRY